MKLIVFLLRTSRLIIVLAGITGIISGAASTKLITLIHGVLAKGTLASAGVIWQFVGLLLLATLCGIASQLLLLHLSQKALVDLRAELSRKILASPLKSLENIGSPRLLAALIDDIRNIGMALPMLPRTAVHVTILICGAIYMVWLSWKVWAICAGFTLVGLLVYQQLSAIAFKAMQVSRKKFDVLFQNLYALNHGIKELKLHWKRRQDFLRRKLEPSLQEFRQHIVLAQSLLIGAENFTRLVFFVLLGLLIFFIPIWFKDFSLTSLNGYIIIMLFLFRSVGLITDAVPRFVKADVALRNIESLELLPTEEIQNMGIYPKASRTSEPNPVSFKEHLKLIGVTSTYHHADNDRAFQVGPVDLDFHPGELVFITGGNGSGKTTFAKLIAGLYPPETGTIHLDGKPITDKNREEYRQLFTAVFAEFHLFQNLLGLQASELDTRAAFYLAQLQLDHKVHIQDGQFSTIDLSHGQRKRLALLVAYLEDRPFYIFDEWAADQDPAFKVIFYTQILTELKERGKTVVVISHDDRYFHIADRHIKMEEGKIVSDSHQK